MQERIRLPPRRSGGARRFANGLTIRTSNKLLIEDTGGDCWKGAVAMARFFEEEAHHVIQGQSILELASGTGILGLQLGVMGAKQVLMTDKASMQQLLEGNIAENQSLLNATCTVVRAASLDWLEATADPDVFAAAPFDTIVMSDVIYEEELIMPLVRTLRRLCHLNLQQQKQQKQTLAKTASNMLDEIPPLVYMSASHRAERLEDIFFAALDPWFDCEELTNTLNPVLRRLLNKDAIAIWVLKVRDSEMLHLVDGIGQICSSQDKVEEEREVKEETEGVYQESSTYSMQGRHESITRNSESQRASVSAESERENLQGLTGKEGEPGEVDISRLEGNAEREIAIEREAENVGRHAASVDGEERGEYLHATSRQHQQVDLELLD